MATPWRWAAFKQRVGFTGRAERKGKRWEVSEVLSDIVLWMFVVCSGIAVGAGLYERRANMPRRFMPHRGSARSLDVDAITADDSRRRFWVYTTTAPLTLLTAAGCVVTFEGAWRTERQYVELRKGTGKIVLPFTAGEVNVLMQARDPQAAPP